MSAKTLVGAFNTETCRFVDAFMGIIVNTLVSIFREHFGGRLWVKFCFCLKFSRITVILVKKVPVSPNISSQVFGIKKLG